MGSCVGIIKTVTDAKQLVDRLKLLVDHDVPTEYRSKISDYAYAWMLLVNLLIKNDNERRDAKTIYTFNKKKESPVITEVLKNSNDKISIELHLKFLKIDEDARETPLSDLLDKILQEIKFIHDIEHKNNPEKSSKRLSYYPNNKVGKDVGLKTYHTSIPSSEVKWDDFHSDATLTKLVFSGLGQIYLTKYIEVTNSKFLYLLNFN